MNILQSEVNALMDRVTNEYMDVATRDPIVESSDDGTFRGDEIDALLAEQEQEKKKLWDRLYQLEEQHIEKSRHQVIGPYTEPDRKQLLKLMNLDKRLNFRVSKEMKKVNTIEQPNELVQEIHFREKLATQIQQFEKTIDILKLELHQVNEALWRETIVLKEAKEIGRSLKMREKDLQQEKSLNVDMEAQLRLKLATVQRNYQVDLKQLTEFLDEHYPVHVVDGAGPLGDECEMKLMLEQLLNKAYDHPDDPYLPLIPGTYWTPYVETLVTAGIARYHPQDKNRLRLENFGKD